MEQGDQYCLKEGISLCRLLYSVYLCVPLLQSCRDYLGQWIGWVFFLVLPLHQVIHCDYDNCGSLVIQKVVRIPLNQSLHLVEVTCLTFRQQKQQWYKHSSQVLEEKKKCDKYTFDKSTCIHGFQAQPTTVALWEKGDIYIRWKKFYHCSLRRKDCTTLLCQFHKCISLFLQCGPNICHLHKKKMNISKSKACLTYLF